MSTVEAGAKEAPSFGAQLQALLDDLNPGALAQLRRGTPQQVAQTPSFWGIYLKFNQDDEQRSSAAAQAAQAAQLRYEQGWALLLQAAALGIRHEAGQGLGKAMALAGWSELRFTRLMRADLDQLLSLVPQLARYLKSKEVGADLDDLRALILTQDPKKAEARRQRLARDYYKTLHSKSAE